MFLLVVGFICKNGDKGAQVKRMQKLLNEQGFICKVDGIFGPVTTKVLNRFKKSVQLQQNGIYNYRAQERLES